MPTINIPNSQPFRFFFYSNDHEPIHVHVEHANCSARFEVSPLRLTHNHGFSTKQIGRIERILLNDKQLIIDAWADYFGTGK